VQSPWCSNQNRCIRAAAADLHNNRSALDFPTQRPKRVSAEKGPAICRARKSLPDRYEVDGKPGRKCCFPLSNHSGACLGKLRSRMGHSSPFSSARNHGGAGQGLRSSTSPRPHWRSFHASTISRHQNRRRSYFPGWSNSQFFPSLPLAGAQKKPISSKTAMVSYNRRLGPERTVHRASDAGAPACPPEVPGRPKMLAAN